MLSKTAFTTLFVATIFGVAFTQQAAAEPWNSEGTTLSKTVRFGDLDISSQDGAKTLLGRIRRAANHVCSGGDARVLMTRGHSFRACVAGASSKAVADLDNPTVTAMYNGSSIRLAKK